MARPRGAPLLLLGTCLLALELMLPNGLVWQWMECFVEAPKRRARQAAWASPDSWERKTCAVHGTGISDRLGCSRSSPSQAMNNADVPAHWSECPGITYCADEHSSCAGCDGGEVTYAPIVDNYGSSGFWLRPEDQDRFETIYDAPGSVQCSHENGPFSRDPAPGRLKACWCKPQRIVKLLSADAQKIITCTRAANHAYSEVVSLSVNGGQSGLRRDRQMGNASFADSRILFSKRARPLNLREGEGYCKQGKYQEYDHHFFSTWALVELRDSRLPPSFRCAYSFGAEGASRTESTYGEDQIASRRYHQWKSAMESSSTIPCWVLRGGTATDSECAVALANPELLVKEDQGFEWFHFSMGLIPALFICGLFSFACFDLVRDPVRVPGELSFWARVPSDAWRSRPSPSQQYVPPPLPEPSGPRPKAGDQVLVQERSDSAKRNGQVVFDDGGTDVPFKVAFEDGSYDYFNWRNLTVI